MTIRTVQHPHLTDLPDRLAKCNDQIGDVTAELGDVLNWQPPEGGWSIAMVLEHLYTTSEAYFGVVKPAHGQGIGEKEPGALEAWYNR